jgi:protein involved in polysaccharide export with SLBB domain
MHLSSLDRSRIAVSLLAAWCAFFWGCTHNPNHDRANPEPRAFVQPVNRPAAATPEQKVSPPFATYNPTTSTVFPDYRLNVGDVIEVIYHVRTGVTPERYRLKVQDLINIRFPYMSTFDQDVRVQSDGTIRLRLIDEVQVVERRERGLSPYHFRQQDDESWQRYRPAEPEGQWEDLTYKLARTNEGQWVMYDGGTDETRPLESVVPVDKSGRLTHPLIVDARDPGGRRERYEYDAVQQRWKTRPVVIEQVGMTAEELEEKLMDLYSDHLREPELTVTVEQANFKIDELKKAITTAPRGQSRLMPVKPDGTIDLPFVGQVLAYGKTVQQLKEDVETAYVQVDLPEISVTVQMNDWAPQKYFVLGEVKGPGLLKLKKPATLLQVLAASGGTNMRAAEDKVMVIRRKGMPVPEATIVDLRSLMTESPQAKAGEVPDFSNLRFDFFLADGDIIYVPSTQLARTGDWVDQVFGRIIRGVMPYQFYTGLNFGYDLHRETQVTRSENGGFPEVNVGVGP